MQTVPITTNVMSSNPAQEVYSIQHYVIKFVSDLQHISVFFRHDIPENIVERCVNSITVTHNRVVICNTRNILTIIKNYVVQWYDI